MTRASLSVLASLCRRAGLSARAGVDIGRTFETERSRGSNAHRERMRTVCERIQAGDSIAEAIDACGDYFPPLTRQLVRVGEETGHLDAALLRLADQYEHRIRMRREFWNSTSRPLFQLVVAFAVISLLIVIMGLIPGSPDLLGFGLRGVSGVLVFWFVIAAIGGILGGAAYALWRGWWGTAPIVIATRIPILGAALETSALARFTWTFGIAVETGMDARDAMKLGLRATNHPIFTGQEPACLDRLRRGEEFHEALAATRVFPRDVVDMVQTGELAGTLAETLLHLSRDYEERARQAARQLAQCAAGLVWLLVAVFLIAMIFRIASVYFGALNEAVRMTQ